MYLLDTDHVSILQRRGGPEFAALSSRLQQYDGSQFFSSIVSFHELVSGWNSYLNRANSADRIVRAYAMFGQILADFAAMQVAEFNDDAARTFETLRSNRIRIATMDLRIASIALDRGWVLLTRNAVDFEPVPGLRMEDWTR